MYRIYTCGNFHISPRSTYIRTYVHAVTYFNFFDIAGRLERIRDILLYMDWAYCRSNSDVLTVRDVGVLTVSATLAQRKHEAFTVYRICTCLECLLILTYNMCVRRFVCMYVQFSKKTLATGP